MVPTDAKYCTKYRGVHILRKPRQKSADGRQYWVYFADVMDDSLASYTLAGIKAQIGRVLNGLTPCGCDVCEYWVKDTPIKAAHCSKDSQLGMFCDCYFFEPSTIRRC